MRAGLGGLHAGARECGAQSFPEFLFHVVGQATPETGELGRGNLFARDAAANCDGGHGVIRRQFPDASVDVDGHVHQGAHIAVLLVGVHRGQPAFDLHPPVR